MTKLVVLTNELPPYRRPIFEALGQRDGLEVTVYLSTRVEPHRLWDAASNLEHVTVHTVPSVAVPFRQRKRTRLVHFPWGVIPALLRSRPDVVLSGEFGFRTLAATIYCALFRRPLIVWSGETERGASTATRLQRALHRRLARQADGFLAYGQAARRYLLTLGTPEDKIDILPQAVDNAFWSAPVSQSEVEALRARYDVSGQVALFVGNLLAPKGIQHLITAWAALPEMTQASNTLLIVGAGEERAKLESVVRSLDIHGVVFVGAVKPADLRPFYAAAAFLVFPTLLDVWGLVVNEAMAGGRPVLCSIYAGCAEELIVPGVTGETFDPTDERNLASLLARFLERPQTASESLIRAHIHRWSFERGVEGILAVLSRLGLDGGR